MISTNDVRPGMALELDDGLFSIVEYQHVKPGKGRAFVRMKLKKLDTGQVLDRTFRADENVQQAIIDRAGIPAHTVRLGAKGCVTWTPEPIRNYRDYKATDFDLAFAQWIHGINRGVLLPPGLDEQWLILLMHDDADAMRYADVFEEFVDELTS